MMLVKVTLFFLIIVSIKYIFKFINDCGDNNIARMKELIDFTEYLQIYSCDMKMSFEEIFLRYEFKSKETEQVCKMLMNELNHEEKNNRKNFVCIMKEIMMTPDEFNKYFTDIIDYYGSAYSDVLDKKLGLTLKEMKNSMNCFEIINSERKNLNNRISLLVGCLVAVILI
ncbi:MAG: hypothetical protein SA378_09360 [Sedimentibacter sp.]|uniref:hypothetical protein n=1 Tax=Sedimentibacter sp. TaxID=1960295 RepID=UPI002982A7F2|nr:hypothetical protein [Sedimentibacter sp.]MDW5300331.1 hypothetical protein [Sedimentibacter sp.]